MGCRDLGRREIGSIWRGLHEERCTLSVENIISHTRISGNEEKKEHMPQEVP